MRTCRRIAMSSGACTCSSPQETVARAAAARDIININATTTAAPASARAPPRRRCTHTSASVVWCAAEHGHVVQCVRRVDIRRQGHTGAAGTAAGCGCGYVADDADRIRVRVSVYARCRHHGSAGGHHFVAGAAVGQLEMIDDRLTNLLLFFFSFVLCFFYSCFS
jgi:hypothetical protein